MGRIYEFRPYKLYPATPRTGGRSLELPLGFVRGGVEADQLHLVQAHGEVPRVRR